MLMAKDVGRYLGPTDAPGNDPNPEPPNVSSSTLVTKHVQQGCHNACSTGSGTGVREHPPLLQTDA